MEKLKKINTELSVSKSASESSMSDLNDKLVALADDRNLLERETAKLQSQLQLEKNQRNEISAHVHEVEARLKTQTSEFDAARAREQVNNGFTLFQTKASPWSILILNYDMSISGLLVHIS